MPELLLLLSCSVVSNSMQPHRRQPTRLPHPWDSPGKTTGVGCHFLLQCRKVKSESEVTQSSPTPSDPMDCRPPGSSVHGILQARVLEWGAIAFCQCRRQGFNSCSARIPHSAKQLSPCATTIEPVLYSPGATTTAPACCYTEACRP